MGCKRRKDSVVMVETLITASPDFHHALPPQEQREYFDRAYGFIKERVGEYFDRAYGFIKERVGEQNILSAVVHMDEKTPHMHLSFCPITTDNRLAAKEILGNPKQMSQWQTDFHAHMSERWPELERGASAIETGRAHIPVWLYKKAERLDERAHSIEGALADINAFNAGKKRDKALALLKEWIPEAQTFTVQLRGNEALVRSLETALAGERGVTAMYRNKAHDAGEESAAAHREAYRLKKELELQQRLLDCVPDEVWTQLKLVKKEKERTRR